MHRGTTKEEQSYRKRPPLLVTTLPWQVLPLAADLHRLDNVLQVVLRDPMVSKAKLPNTSLSG